jgi:DHA2 family multidrug resistance protein
MNESGTAMAPSTQRTMITVCVVLAVIMQALDTTIANVALPYMQGSVSASSDQINWVLTSYIVAAAIMTPPSAFLARRFGRKTVLLWAIIGFVLASILCVSCWISIRSKSVVRRWRCLVFR